jgi:hypothetical protein
MMAPKIKINSDTWRFLHGVKPRWDRWGTWAFSPNEDADQNDRRVIWATGPYSLCAAMARDIQAERDRMTGRDTETLYVLP